VEGKKQDNVEVMELGGVQSNEPEEKNMDRRKDYVCRSTMRWTVVGKETGRSNRVMPRSPNVGKKKVFFVGKGV